jgi:hypothetical protein
MKHRQPAAVRPLMQQHPVVVAKDATKNTAMCEVMPGARLMVTG